MITHIVYSIYYSVLIVEKVNYTNVIYLNMCTRNIGSGV